MRFQIALTNVSFDQDYENVLRFETKEEQQQFFGVSTLFSNAININFTARNLLNTTAYFRLENGQSLKELLTKNYAIVKDTKFDEYYYYFINSISQDDDGQVHLRLQLDVFQTFYIDAKFSDCQIERANLNRFIDNNDGTVSFDGGVDSKLFEREPLKDFAKYLIRRETSQPLGEISDSNARSWVRTNVEAWAYIFLDPQHLYNIEGKDKTLTTKFETLKINDAENSVPLDSQVALACVPIMKGNKRIDIHMKSKFIDETVSVTTYNIRNFLERNEGGAFVWAYKVSKIPPFFALTGTKEYPLTWTVSGDVLTLTAPFVSGTSTNGDIHGKFINGNTCVQEIIIGNTILGVLCPLQQTASSTFVYNSKYKFDFAKDEIVGAKKNFDFNPKLLSADFHEIRLGEQTQYYNYDLQKLNHNNLQIIYTEPLTPDISRAYIRFRGVEGTCYSPDTSKNFTGAVTQNDTSLVLATTAYQNMLANNKNFFLQNSINRGANAAIGGFSSGVSLGLGFATGNILGVAGGVLGALRTTSNLIKDSVNEYLTVDNLKNAPTALQNAQGSVMINYQTAQIGIVTEEYDCLPNEKKIANDYMDAFGFTSNRIDNVKNNDNIRHFHNYVKADISEMTGVSNEIRQVFVEAFARGVRFWNAKNITDKSNPFNYEMENYENWLAE